MMTCLFKVIGFLLMAVAFLPLGLAQSASLSYSTSYTATTLYKTVTVVAASGNQSYTSSLLPATGAGKVLTTNLPSKPASDITMPDVQTDSTCTSAGIVFDCQAAPTSAYSAQVTDFTKIIITTMANGAIVTSTSVVSSTITPSVAVLVDTTITSTSTFIAPTTVVTTQYVLSKSSASPTYGNQYAALLLSGGGGQRLFAASQAIITITSFIIIHMVAMAFF